MKKSFLTETHQFAWDATSIEAAQRCLQYYKYSIIDGLQSKNKSVHLIFGGLYATALEHFYKYRAEGSSIEEALHRVIRETLEGSWDHSTGLPIAFDDTNKTRFNLIRTIVWYVEQFGEETEDGVKTYHLADGTPAVELSFAVEVEDELVFCGHLDRVVEFADRLYVMDQKTTGGTVGPYYFRQFDLSNQMSLYTWAGKITLHSPISGVIIDAAQIALNFTRFERAITTRTAPQLEEWFLSARYTISQAHRASDSGHWPRNYTSCGNYGGCPFTILCSSTPSIRKNYIETEYTKRIWDPLVPR